MRSALYYPHTTVEDESLIKTALLLWDRLEFIVPWKGFRDESKNPLVQRAMEVIGEPRVPEEDEQKEVHTRIEELIAEALPPQFYYDDQMGDPDSYYEIYPQKLLPKTWDILNELNLRGNLLPNADYPVMEPVGLTLMSILADCCAGTTRSRVTDRGAAYAALAGVLQQDVAKLPRAPQSAEETLVPLALEVVDIKSVSLKKLIELREREKKSRGLATQELRHRYVDSLETYVKRLTTEKARKSDAREIARQFKDDMKIDLENLKKELRSALGDVIFSKEILVSAIAGVGSAAAWAFGVPIPILGTVTAVGAPATVGGLLGAGNKYLSARRAIMQRHPMAYLYKLR